MYGDIILQLIKKLQTYFPKIRKRNKNSVSVSVSGHA